MKTWFIVAALVAGVALSASPADAKKRPRHKASHIVAPQADPYVVRDYDGEILGRDPDPFIRLMLLKEGKIRDQSGH